MRQVAENPHVVVCILVENFTADGIAENLGWVCDKRNTATRSKLRTVFEKWYDEANHKEDQGTCILRIRLTQGLWNDPHAGIARRIDFQQQVAD